MAYAIRSVVMGLPRVPMSRIPLVAIANSSHPSAYSSMTSHKKDSSSPNWADSAKKVAEELERKAEQLADSIDKTTKEYLREVKEFESAEDELMKEMGLAMNNPFSHMHQDNHSGSDSKKKSAGTTGKGKHSKEASHSSGKARGSSMSSSPSTFEDTLEDQLKADLIHSGTKRGHRKQDHDQEMVSSLMEELKAESHPNLSQHASDAIRMVESHNVLKQDQAPIHAVRDEDPTQKTMASNKHK
ncbi:hypothetical protein BGZ58_004842 [Dissophora ornata]|nr:hypothetical protein BGZ58_004842 [Dissophora ornata]